MKPNSLFKFAAIATAFALTTHAYAVIIAGLDIIAPPPSVIDDAPGAENTHQQGFNERQGVLLVAPLAVNGGNVPAGTLVNSHMIFLNTPGMLAVTSTATWTFDNVILGVMSDGNGNLEFNSTPLLGAVGTVYPAPFANRGLEGGDSLLIAGNQLTVTMSVTEPGDWIRVVTRATTVPDAGSTLVLLALGACFLGACRRWLWPR